MHRAVANKNGTIEVSGNIFRFLQPLDELKTDDIIEIEKSYRQTMDIIGDDKKFITADNIEMKNGQIMFEYNVQGLKMFDYLRTLFLDEKLEYLWWLVQFAKENRFNILWQKENFVIDIEEETVKCMVVEHDVLPLVEQKDKTEALKELIILSLTSLNNVYGKPRRADFLEQNEDVIQFAEKVYLRAKTIEDIQEFIDTELYRLDMRRREEEESQHQQNRLQKLFNRNKKQKEQKRHAILSKMDSEKESEGASPIHNKSTKSQGNNIKLFIGLGGLIVGALFLSAFLQNATDNTQTASSTVDAEENETDVSSDILTIYRNAFFESTEDTIAQLEEIGYENLSEEDQGVLDQLYINSGDYNKAINHNPELATEVAENLYKEEKMKQLQEFNGRLEEPNDTVAMYTAMAEGDWLKILDIYENVSLNEEMKQAVLTAFLQEGKASDAETFVQSMENPSEELEERLSSALSIQEDIYEAENSIAKLEKELEDAKKSEAEDISEEIKDYQDQVEKLNKQMKDV